MHTETTSTPSGKISAFAISYNREELIETCLKSLRFADELIVVDKSSSDRTVEIAEQYADRVIVVPWSPTVEETRAFALSQCTHDNIVFLDDDEVLSVPAVEYIRKHAREKTLSVAAFPQRHYILGRHDENAHYWPEHQIRAFPRGSLEFGDKVHAGVHVKTNQIDRVSIDSGVCTHNLSYRSAEEWIEKTNRYTSIQNRRFLAEDSARPLPEFVRERLEYWLSQRHVPSPYVDVVAVLRAIYDIIDRIKIDETSLSVAPERDFQKICHAFNEELDAFGRTVDLDLSPRSTGAKAETACTATSAKPNPSRAYAGDAARSAELRQTLAERGAEIDRLQKEMSALTLEQKGLVDQLASQDVLLARKNETEAETQGKLQALQDAFRKCLEQNAELQLEKSRR